MNQIRSWIHGDNTNGLTGSGVGVAVLDTGCFPHTDLSNRIAGFYDMLRRRPSAPYDDNGHGTHVCGTIAGNGASSNGRYRGIAPGCHVIPVKVLDRRGNGYASDVLAGLRVIRENKALWNIRIVNISVGSLSRKNMGENSALVRGVDEAWDDGLVIVVAAGNMGPRVGTITTPGISRKVITVGCSNDQTAVDISGKRIINFSGRGPTSSCICKPDIVAPGALVTSCSNQPFKYASRSGTSMSTPIVSGAIALLIEKYPQISNRDVKLLLRERAVDLGLPKNQQGWGGLDVRELLR